MKRNSFGILMCVFILMNFVLNMSASVFNGILDEVATELNVSVSRTGMLSAMYSYGAGIGVPIFLIIFSKIRRDSLLKATLFFNILATMAMIAVRNFDLLLVCRFMMGLLGNCYSILAITLVASLASKDKIGFYLSLLIAGSALAMVVGVPVVRILSGILHWREIFIGLIVLMILSLLVFQIYLKDSEEADSSNLLNELKFLKKREVLFCLITSFITFLGYGMQTYLTPYLLRLFPRISPYLSCMLVSIGVASFIGNFIGGIFCDKIGYQKCIVLGSCMQCLTSLLIIFSRNNFYLNCFFIILWMMNAWFIGLQINTAINVATEGNSRFIVSLNSSGIQLGTAIGTSIAGFIISKYHIGYISITSVITSFVVAMIYVKIIKVKTK